MIPLWLLCAYACFELVSVPVYVRILFLFCTRPAFDSPFYKMLVLLGCLDLHLFLVHLLGVRLPLSQYFANFYADLGESRWIGLIHFCTFFLAYTDYSLHIAITLNRFTSIAIPMQHSWLWHQILPAVSVAAFLVGLGLAGHRLFCIGTYIPFIRGRPELGFTGLPIRYLLWQLNDSLVLAFVGLGCAIFCFLLNSATFVMIFRHKRAQKALQVGKSSPGICRWSGEEVHMFVVSLNLMFSQAVYASFNVIYFFIRRGTTTSADFYLKPQAEHLLWSVYTLFHQLAWMTDLFVFGLPWLLIGLNRTLRAELIPKRLKKKMAKLAYERGIWKTPVTELNTMQPQSQQQRRPSQMLL